MLLNALSFSELTRKPGIARNPARFPEQNIFRPEMFFPIHSRFFYLCYVYILRRRDRLQVLRVVIMAWSRHSAKVVARGRQRTLGRAVRAQPVRNFRPFAQGQADHTGNAATGLPSYMEWAAFMAGAQVGDFGFGAYFTDERDLANKAQPETSMTEYTWTPAGAR